VTTFLLGCVVGGLAVAAVQFWPHVAPALTREVVLDEWREACGRWAAERRSEIVLSHWTGDRE
jgi:hypothetical protein